MTGKTKQAAVAAALVMAGGAVGAAFAVSGSATAATGGSSTTTTDTDNDGDHAGGHAGETPLTGTTADKVKAAALAKYPGATIDRLETDSDGVYEAHLVTADGSDVNVQVGKDFAVTGTQTGLGGHGDHDGDGPGGADDDAADTTAG